MCTAKGKWLHLLPRMLFLRLKNGYLPKRNLLVLDNVYDSLRRNSHRSDLRSRRRRVEITWERVTQKNMFSSRLHDMSLFQLFQRQTLQNNSFLSCSSSFNSSWRSFDFTLSSLGSATRERDWFVSRGCLKLWLTQLSFMVPMLFLIPLLFYWLVVFLYWFWDLSCLLNIKFFLMSKYFRFIIIIFSVSL